MNDEYEYYNRPSREEARAMAFWCFVACMILAVLGFVGVVLQ